MDTIVVDEATEILHAYPQTRRNCFCWTFGKWEMAAVGCGSRSTQAYALGYGVGVVAVMFTLSGVAFAVHIRGRIL